MGKIHMKGRMLQYLLNGTLLWDYEIADRILEEYGLEGDYWKGTVRVSLADLFSGGLVESIEEKTDDGKYFGPDKLLFRYRLTEFGRARMVDTGLL